MSKVVQTACNLLADLAKHFIILTIRGDNSYADNLAGPRIVSD